MNATETQVKRAEHTLAGKILIVDDVATNRIVLKVKLAAACYETVFAATGAEALQLARGELPDLILLDVKLPDIDGIDVCERLKADPVTRDIPVVMITAFNDARARMAALRAGADDYLSKPIDDLVLLARLRSLLRARETEAELRLRDLTCRDLGFAEAAARFSAAGTVALVTGSRKMAEAWKARLAGHMTDRLVTLDGDAALAEPDGAHPIDVFVIAADLVQPGAGLRLMSELRSRPATRHAAICILVAADARETAAMALDLGAGDLILEGAEAEEVALRIRAQLDRKRLADRLRDKVADGLRMAVTDPLTGLYNRRYALPHLARIAERSGETGRLFAVMVLDLDRFKSVNDTWGHAAGDAVLTEVAARLRANLRAVDLIARIGGEEFMVALPDTTLEAARATAERLRQVVEERAIRLPRSVGEVRVTMSVGLAMGSGRDGVPHAVEDIIGEADRALLGSKSDGRNTVTVGRTAA